MELFNDFDLHQKVNRIVTRINAAADPNRVEEITENGIFIAQRLLEETRDDLEYIKGKVSASHVGYIEVSGEIALAAAGCIQFPVSFMMMRTQASDFYRVPGLKSETKAKLGEAARVMAQISSMTMRYEVRQLINRVTQKITQTETKINGGSSGCFVATFVYGDYDAKEVLQLRYFRDNVLSKSTLGIVLIRTYYFFSPLFVHVFAKIPNSRKGLKYIMDKIVKKVEKL